MRLVHEKQYRIPCHKSHLRSTYTCISARSLLRSTNLMNTRNEEALVSTRWSFVSGETC